MNRIKTILSSSFARFIGSSALSTCVEYIFFFLTMLLFGKLVGEKEVSILGLTTLMQKTLYSSFVTRAVSSFFNFNMNKKFVFGGNGSYKKTLLRYYTLAICQMLISAWLISALTKLLGNTEAWASTLVKIPVDFLLFFLSYKIQKNWVFKKEKA